MVIKRGGSGAPLLGGGVKMEGRVMCLPLNTGLPGGVLQELETKVLQTGPEPRHRDRALTQGHRTRRGRW